MEGPWAVIIEIKKYILPSTPFGGAGNLTQGLAFSG
jgi:hypothetical protein